MTTYRKAEPADVPEIFALINRYAAERVMLPRALDDLTASVQEFTVAVEKGRVVACGSLKPISSGVFFTNTTSFPRAKKLL